MGFIPLAFVHISAVNGTQKPCSPKFGRFIDCTYADEDDDEDGKAQKPCCGVPSQVALEALSGHKPIAYLSADYGVHQIQINNLVRQLKNGADGVFTGEKLNEKYHREKDIERYMSKWCNSLLSMFLAGV